MTDLQPGQAARKWFAEELYWAAELNSPAVVAAFATVPRERFVGSGPWRIRSPRCRARYRTTPDADPRHVYHDVLIALDETRQLNNGLPSLWAGLLDHLSFAGRERVLHLGCGTGYYTAIIAELAGPDGVVTAVEIDPALAEAARTALVLWPRVTVVNADGAAHDPGRANVIVVSAGMTHPLPIWLDSLLPGGRLLIPLTATERGGMLMVTRRDANANAARFICPVGFIEFAGGREPSLIGRLESAFARGDMYTVQSLRREPHGEDDSCWLHADGWCLSRRPASGSQA